MARLPLNESWARCYVPFHSGQPAQTGCQVHQTINGTFRGLRAVRRVRQKQSR